MLKYILKENIKGNLVGFVLMLCLFTAVFSLFNYLIFIKILLSDNQARYSQNISDNYVDIEFNQEYSPLYSSTNGESNLKTMYEKLASAKEFKYYEIYSQFLYIFNYTGSPIFREAYEAGNPYKEDEDMKIYGVAYPPAAAIKTVQLSNNCFSDFSLNLSEGRKFEKNDYFYSINETVPIILGYEYKKQYKLGQKLQGIYIAEPFNFEIIGFLEKDNYIQIARDVQYLDRYIIMPCFNCEKPINPQDKIFQIRHYGLKTSGILKSAEGLSNYKIKTIINKMAKESGLKNYTVWPRDNNAGDQKTIGEDMLLGFIILCSILLLFSSAFIVITFNRRILRNMGTYWAYLVSGVNVLTIKRSIQLEILIILVLSNILTFAIQLLFYRFSLIYISMIISISFMVWLITAKILGNTFLNKLLLKNAGEE